MIFDQQKYDRIDLYLLDGMNQQERKVFEKELNENPVLLEEVNQIRELVAAMKGKEEEEQFAIKMKGFHHQIEPSTLKKPIELLPKTKRFNAFSLAVTLAVAASVSALIVLTTLYTTGWFTYGKHESLYEELKVVRNDIDDISSKQDNLWDAITSKAKPKAIVSQSGSGFVISSNGYLVTNFHVIKDVDSVCISNIRDSLVRYRVRVAYNDTLNDLTILKVDDSAFTKFDKVPYVFKNKPSDLGETVYTLGFSKKDIVFGDGSISALSGFKGDTAAYQVSIPVNPGNSGGPLFDASGNILGIISGKHSKKAGAAFAIRSFLLLNIIDSVEVDSMSTPPVLPVKNQLSWRSRTDQIKRIKPFIYKVEVYQEFDDSEGY